MFQDLFFLIWENIFRRNFECFATWFTVEYALKLWTGGNVFENYYYPDE